MPSPDPRAGKAWMHRVPEGDAKIGNGCEYIRIGDRAEPFSAGRWAELAVEARRLADRLSAPAR